MRTTWTFHSAGQLVFGPHAVDQLGELAGRMKLGRMLIVTDRALVGRGLAETVAAPLRSAGIVIEVFDVAVARAAGDSNRMNHRKDHTPLA